MRGVEVSTSSWFFTLLLCLTVALLATKAYARPEDNREAYIRTDIVKPTEDAMKTRWPLLTLDGGGLRGIVTTEVLIEVENAIKKILVELPDVRVPETKYSSPNEFEIDLADYFRGIAGVSTGSWIACYLASRGGNGASKRVFDNKLIIKQFGKIRAGSVEGLRVFFMHYAKQLYAAYSIPITWAPRLWRPLSFHWAGVDRPRYPARQLETTLDLFLGQTTYVETQNTTLMTLSYDLIRKAAIFFVSDHIGKEEVVTTFILQNEKEPRSLKSYTYTTQQIDGKNYYMKDIARASSASPTIFEAKRFTALNDESFRICAIDGSVMSNNPTLMASYFLLENPTVDQSKVSILSIGMGIPTGRYRKHAESGAMQWFFQTNDFLSIVMDGGSEYIQTVFASVFYNGPGMKKVLTKKNPYLRIQLAFDTLTPEGEALSQMYNGDIMKQLQNVGKQMVDQYKGAIAKFVRDNLASKGDKPSILEFESLLMSQLFPTSEKEPSPEASPPPPPPPANAAPATE